MTRLRTQDISEIPSGLHEYDRELVLKTGCSLRDLSCRAAGISPQEAGGNRLSFRIGIIPITGGKGVIKGFSTAVYGILSHLGFDAFVTASADVAGLAEAFEKEADAVMLADDVRFVIIDTINRKVVDNAVATARGYVEGLDRMARGLKEKEVLVIGCGPVGKATVVSLVGRGANVSVFDIHFPRCRHICQAMETAFEKEIGIAPDLEAALREKRLIIDATPARNIILARHIGPGMYIAAPGVPVGLDPEAQSQMGNRLLHDKLEIGVATMAFSTYKSRTQEMHHHDKKQSDGRTLQTILPQTG